MGYFSECINQTQTKMTDLNQTVKAVRAVIQMADMSVECFQLPDGGYTYGIEMLAQIAAIDKKLLSDKKSIYDISRLSNPDGVSNAVYPNVKVEGINKPYKTITQAQFGVALASLARMGHPKALAILTASFEESLERRADAAFGVKRTEQERNARYRATS